MGSQARRVGLAMQAVRGRGCGMRQATLSQSLRHADVAQTYKMT